MTVACDCFKRSAGVTGEEMLQHAENMHRVLQVVSFSYIFLWDREIYPAAILKGQGKKREKWDDCA